MKHEALGQEGMEGYTRESFVNVPNAGLLFSGNVDVPFARKAILRDHNHGQQDAKTSENFVASERKFAKEMGESSYGDSGEWV